MPVGSKGKGRKKPGSKNPFLCAVFHETNMALCLAGGFLTPRYEQNAARDHHLKAGGVVLNHTPVTASILRSARGGIDYGVVVLAEVDSEGLNSWGVSTIVGGPIPLARVHRLLFKTAADRDDFSARNASYGDIPWGVVQLGVFPEGFGDDTGNEYQEDLEPEVKPQPVDVADTLVDKVGGAVAGLLGAMRARDLSDLMIPLGIFNSGASLGTPGGFAQAVASLLDTVESGTNPYRNLATVIGNLLARMNPREGLDAHIFIKSVCEGLSSIDGADSSAIEKFIDRSGDIISARVEIAADGWHDAPGKVSPRALLLFALNPGLEQVFGMAGRRSEVGDKIFLLASVFAGCFAGLTNLPREAKVLPSNSKSFLGLGLLVNDLCLDQVPKLDVKEEWTSSGVGRRSLYCSGYEVTAFDVYPSKFISQVVDLAKEAGWHYRFSNMGELTLESSGREFSVRVSNAPVFPIEESVEISCIYGKKSVSIKEKKKILGSISSDAIFRGVFIRFIEVGKRVAAEFFSHCLASKLSKEAILDAMKHVLSIIDSISPDEKKK